MRKNITTRSLPHSEIEKTEGLFDNWFDPIEVGVRDRVRGFIESMLEAELEDALSRSRYARRKESSENDSGNVTTITGHRTGIVRANCWAPLDRSKLRFRGLD